MYIRKTTAALLCAAMLGGPLGALAGDFITVDEWAYKDVSNFRSEKLMPEAMENITDYRTDITRGQLAMLLFSAMVNAHYMTDTGYSSYFEDTDVSGINELGAYQILQGETSEFDEYGTEYRYFYPDRLITREDMAVIMYRAMKERAYMSGELSEPSDYGEISDYAKEAVCSLIADGILSGTVNNRFEPKGNLTIEQAVTVVYRFYKSLPTAPYADGQGIEAETETFLQAYRNGLTETKKGGMLYLKNGGETLLQFETDVYTNIYCETVNGTIYAVAQNINNKTDIYNAETGEILFKAPYPVSETDNEYIVTKSSVIGQCSFGLYDYTGKEVLKPVYSMQEIEQLKANGFNNVSPEYRAADGWCYFADWSDNGHLYKIDTNGENLQKLSDNDCFNITYIDGWLYYSIRGEYENKLYAMKADGTCEQRLTENNAKLLFPTESFTCYDPDGGRDIFFVQSTGEQPVYADGWVYYLESVPDADYSGNIWRMRMTDTGAVKEKISDIKVEYIQNYDGHDIQYENGRLYFTNYDDGQPGVYSFDGDKVIKVSGDPELDYMKYSFWKDKLVIAGRDDEDEKVFYIAEPDGSGMHEWQMTEEEKKESLEMYYSEVFSREDVIYTDENGTERHKAINHQESDDEHTVYWEYRVIEYSDGSGGGENVGLFVEDSDGTVNAMHSGWAGGFRRVGDNFFYPCSEVGSDKRMSQAIWQYNMKTHEQKRIVAGVKSFGYNITDRWLLYTDYSDNYRRYDIKTGETAEVYPNAGINRYGEVKEISRSGMLKIDADGNILKLTDGAPMYWSYVPNGAVMAGDDAEKLYIEKN